MMLLCFYWHTCLSIESLRQWFHSSEVLATLSLKSPKSGGTMALKECVKTHASTLRTVFFWSLRVLATAERYIPGQIMIELAAIRRLQIARWNDTP